MSTGTGPADDGCFIDLAEINGGSHGPGLTDETRKPGHWILNDRANATWSE